MIIEKIESIFFKTQFQVFSLILLGGIFFIPFIGNVHLFDWDEINFAEISREMMITGDYFISQVDFKQFYEKPPLFNWIQILSFELFGMNDFAARFPNALFGIFSLLAMFLIGKRERSTKFGMLWALCYFSSFFPHFYFKTGVIDPVFNFFIFISVVFALKANEKKSSLLFFVKGLINGLAILTKGPVALLLLGLTWGLVILFKERQINKRLFVNIFLLMIGILCLLSVWFIPLVYRGGTSFFKEFVSYMIELLTQDVATHGQPFYYHFLVVFFGCFPISIIAIRNLFKNQFKSKIGLNGWMFSLFWVVLIVFSLVKTKIVHYSSMTYFPLAYLAADVLSKDPKKIPVRLLKIVGIFFFIVFFLMPIIISTKKEWLLNLVSNDVVAVDIVKDLNISVFAAIPSLFLLIGLLFLFSSIKTQKIKRGLTLYALFFGIFMSSFMFIVLPPVEKAVQGGAISFYKEFSNQDVYLTTIGFYSYGRVYYFQKKKSQSKYSETDFLTQPIDKPVYFVTKSNYEDKNILRYEGVQFVEKRGAYKLFVRKP